jgi:hypothetical protein
VDTLGFYTDLSPGLRTNDNKSIKRCFVACNSTAYRIAHDNKILNMKYISNNFINSRWSSNIRFLKNKFHDKHHTPHTPLSHGLLVGLEGVQLPGNFLTVNVYGVKSGDSPFSVRNG